MSTLPEPTITLDLDLTNPGHFFACCGLLELADRMWPGAEGWFDGGRFLITGVGTLPELIEALTACPLTAENPKDAMESPLVIGPPFGDLRLDWWQRERSLKVWAGSMRGVRIAEAMRAAIGELRADAGLLNASGTVYVPNQPRLWKNKVEPFYYDGRRGANATSLNIGLAPDALKMTTSAFPAVEFLTLVGLQRFRPRPTDWPRVFDYTAWDRRAEPLVAAVLTSGAVSSDAAPCFRFECGFRTDQRKHKAFLPASPIHEL